MLDVVGGLILSSDSISDFPTEILLEIFLNF